MATPAKPAAAPAAKPEAPPARNNKKWIIIIVLILLINGGTTAYLLLKPRAPAGDKTEAAHSAAVDSKPPLYIPLGTFTANLIHEEGDRYLQVAISIKVSKPELQEQIKARNPEILHHVNMLLENQLPSQLATIKGKEQLASDIKAQIEEVLGPRNSAPAINQAKPATNEPRQTGSGIEEVLFTSFIIQ